MGYSQLCALNSLSATLGDHAVRGITLGTKAFSRPLGKENAWKVGGKA